MWQLHVTQWVCWHCTRKFARARALVQQSLGNETIVGEVGCHVIHRSELLDAYG